MCTEVYFNLEDLNLDNLILWLNSVAKEENHRIEQLSYTLCSDRILADLNKKYLNHDTYTDILTFPYDTDPINADVYISLDRVKENAKLYGDGNLIKELLRVIVHGLLHMCGHQDRSSIEKDNMRLLESYYVSQILQ